MNLTFDELAWDKAAWHYIAITWKKDKDYYILSLTCDNKTSRKKFIANDKKSLDDLLMSFGSVVATMGSLDSVQLSNKALSQDKLDNNYKKGLTKNAYLIFSKKGNDINKLKAIKLKQQDFVPIYQNKATKKLKVTSRGLIIKPSQEVKGKHSSKAAQFHHAKINI